MGVNLAEGQVAVKKGSGKIKIRKGQSEEHYQAQKSQFWNQGPTINTQEWLLEASPITSNSKTENAKSLHKLEKLYFTRNYRGCLNESEALSTQITDSKILEDIRDIKARCENRLR